MNTPITSHTPAPDGAVIAFGKSKDRPTARYVSAATVLEEAVHEGRLLSLYWSAAGQVQRENVVDSMPWVDPHLRPLHAFELVIDGQSLHSRWEFVSSTQRPGPRGTIEAVISLRHQIRAISLNVVTRLDGSAILVRYLEITNTGSAPAALVSMAPWSGALWSVNTDHPGHHTYANPAFDSAAQPAFSIGYFGGEIGGQEGDFIWRPLDVGGVRIERTGLGHPWSPPYYIVRNNVTGAMFFMGLAWSGNYYAQFNHTPSFPKLKDPELLCFSLGPVAPAPMRMIAPGETITSPLVHMGALHCQFDQAIAQWHRHLRRSVIPVSPKGREMLTIGGRVVEAPGDWILREIDIAADMGIEGFMVDAGWYGGPGTQFSWDWGRYRGDWVDAPWLPEGGIRGIRDYAHKKGMQFGLWHEPEIVRDATQVFKDHPDWMLRRDDGQLFPAGDGAAALDLANPAAAAHFEQCVLRVLRDYKLDFYKIDHNFIYKDGGQSLRDGYAESEFYRHYEVLYATYDKARRECPNARLENCAGGGGRLDLAMLARFHYHCESDWSEHPYGIRAINSLTLFVPPEALCYYHNHLNSQYHGVQSHLTAEIETHLRVTLFALPIYVGFGAQDADRNSQFYQTTRRYIDLHKGFCRPILSNHPTVHHHTPDIGLFAPADFCVLEYAAPDRQSAYAGIFKLSSAGAQEYIFRPRGLDPARTYEVTYDNERLCNRLSGHQLRQEGLRICLDSALTSELLCFTAV